MIGALGGLLCYGSLVFFEQFLKIDDPVLSSWCDNFGVMVVPFTNAEATSHGQIIGVCVF